MPVRIKEDLPAYKALTNENIFVMSEARAQSQDIRPLQLAILNIMPTKEVTETQLLRLIGNTPLQVDVTLLHTASHTSKNTSAAHFDSFYRTFNDVKPQKFDALIITGAPVEKLDFCDVNYWNELIEIMDWSVSNVYSTMFICWGAQAGLNHFYGINKRPIEKKLTGVFLHHTLFPNEPLLRGFDESFYAPHSRYTTVSSEDIRKTGKLRILAESDEAGAYIISGRDGRQIFITGHAEYDRDTLRLEYERDLAKGYNPEIPKNYFKNDNPLQRPVFSWRSHATLLFSNWLNYCVYQETPYDINTIN